MLYTLFLLSDKPAAMTPMYSRELPTLAKPLITRTDACANLNSLTAHRLRSNDDDDDDDDDDGDGEDDDNDEDDDDNDWDDEDNDGDGFDYSIILQ
ncbi:hypothetical protein ElyMa_005748400 [Elysia marginata]|uniref:Uncharacterized protein n=1 Tax=Elysia marginata TaxID=1093978 RepID=A0AAV4FPH2_9GAST|nr:hypothetical protein ElyMa_005748400 [Elysia marginata]